MREVAIIGVGMHPFGRHLDKSLSDLGREATWAAIDVKMEVGGVEQTVNVTADSPLVDVTSKEIGGNITSETLVQLPSVNGNFIGFVGLLPGIVPSISTISTPSRLLVVSPYFKQCSPPEFSATLPPMVQAIWLDGSGP